MGTRTSGCFLDVAGGHAVAMSDPTLVLLASMVAALAETPAAADKATAAVLEALRGLEPTRAAHELAATFFARVATSSELRAHPHQRRAFARVADALAELLDAACVPPPALRLLLRSAASSAREESAVAAEVVLSILAAGSDAAWTLVWAAFAEAPAQVAVRAIMIKALERAPERAFVQLRHHIDVEATRFAALELVFAAGTAGLQALAEADAVTLLEMLLRVAQSDANARNVGTALLAVVTASHVLPAAHIVAVFDRCTQAVRRALCWDELPASLPRRLLRTAGAFTVFHLYATCPAQLLQWARATCAPGGDARLATALRALFLTHSFTLHPGLVLWSDAQHHAPPLVPDCWADLWRSRASPLPPGASPAGMQELPSRTATVAADGAEVEPAELEQVYNDWEEVARDTTAAEHTLELEAIEMRLSDIVDDLSLEAQRAGLRPFPALQADAAACSEGEARACVAYLRTQVLFEQLLRVSLLARTRRSAEPTFDALAAATPPRGTSWRAVSTASTDDDGGEDTAASSAAVSPHGVLAPPAPLPPPLVMIEETAARAAESRRLQELLRDARLEVEARKRSEQALEQQVHALLLANEQLREQQAAPTAKVAGGAGTVEALREDRVLVLEAELELMRTRLRAQDEYEAELARLQHDLADWDARAAQQLTVEALGLDAGAQLAAAHERIGALERQVQECKLLHRAAVLELSAVGADINKGTEERMRLERELDNANINLHRTHAQYAERLEAVHRKYRGLQELHVGLQKQVMELQRALRSARPSNASLSSPQ